MTVTVSIDSGGAAAPCHTALLYPWRLVDWTFGPLPTCASVPASALAADSGPLPGPPVALTAARGPRPGGYCPFLNFDFLVDWEGPRDTFLDPKFAQEHDAHISFGHRARVQQPAPARGWLPGRLPG